MPRVNCSCAVEFPIEANACISRCILHSSQVHLLLLYIEIIWRRDEVHCNLVLRYFAGRDHFHELHNISDLVEKADVWIRDDNLAGAGKPRPEEVLESEPLLILAEYPVALTCIRSGFGLLAA